MEPQITPEAYFDSLFLANKLDEYFGSFKLEEIHLFSYFTSLLFISQGNPPADWSHKYTIKDGYPFCKEIQEALDSHALVGNIIKTDIFYDVTEKSVNKMNIFLPLLSFQERIKLLQAVCTSSILMTYSKTIHALLGSPDIVETMERPGSKWIHQDLSNEIISDILKDLDIYIYDPLLPAVSLIERLSTNNVE